MGPICSTCSRVNPREAAYCYYDGSLLPGHAANGGAVRAGPRAFPHEFVFPSGRICRNFDEFTLACQENWPDAVQLLQQGYLESFLGSLGRADLAMAARQAARFPDRDRGLDQFLTKLPSQVLEPPKLRVEPRQVNLGLLQVGEDRHIEVHLANQGMRLVHGVIAADKCPWLFVGEAPGMQRKLFQFTSELVVPVHVRGKLLWASSKPQEGRLVIDSSGGTAAVLVRLEVPVQPFAAGLLAGARTPRQIAEKARASPRQVAELFESGAVASWYRHNGWSYPIQGPAASGLAAVQQFFEALGLTPPPRLSISERFVGLNGNVGDRLEHVLELKTEEKRAVYAHAASDQPWLEVGRAALAGRTAAIALVVPAVPNCPGETLRAHVTVTGNGNQRFLVPVNLVIGESIRPKVGAVEVYPRARLVGGWGGMGDAMGRGHWASEGPEVRKVPPVAAVAAQPPAPPHSYPPQNLGAGKRAGPAAETTGSLVGDRDRGGEAGFPAASPTRRLVPAPVHWLPVAFLALGLLVALVHDVFKKGDAGALGDGLLDPEPRIAIRFHDRQDNVILSDRGMKPAGVDPDEGKPATWLPSMRFGLVMLGEKDRPGQNKRLTFDEQGRTNNTCVRLDGDEWLFGERPFQTPDGREVGQWPGRWKERDVALGQDRSGRRRQGRQSVWIYDEERVAVTQIVELVPGEQSHLLDTCLVRYRIENQDSKPHRVGLRFLLDTYIGANDGVPFTIPGAKYLCDTMRDFKRPEDVPDFIQALEREDLANPGTVAHLQLRLGGSIEPPSRVTLGAWPNVRLSFRDGHARQEKTLWEVPVLPIKSLPPGDSAVTIYWNERVLNPGQSREVGFAYGLGSLASSEGGGKLALTAGGSFSVGDEFTVTAYVSNPGLGQTLTLEAPGLQLTEGNAVQSVPPVPPEAASRNSPVTWKLKALRAGKYLLKVRSNTGVSQTQTLTIKTRQIFD